MFATLTEWRSRRWLLAAVGLVVALAAVVVPVGRGDVARASSTIGSPTELLTNPGFEAGATGWGAGNYQIHTMVGTTVPKEGTRHLYVSGSQPWASLAQIRTVNAAAGDSYRCSIWARAIRDEGSGSVNTAPVTLALWALGNGQESSSTPITVGLGWTLVSVELDVARSHGQLKCELYLQGNPVEVDQASLIKEGLNNSGFETGTGSWGWGRGNPSAPVGAGNMSVARLTRADRPDVREGYSMARYTTWDGSSLASSPVVTSLPYASRCTMWVKSLLGGSVPVKVYATRTSATGATLGVGVTNAVTQGYWTKVSATVANASGTTSVRCQLTAPNGQDLLVDAASLTSVNLTNPSLEGTSGWRALNGPVAFSSPNPAVAPAENSSYVTAAPQTPWASVSQDTWVGPGAHRCTMSLRPAGYNAWLTLTIWDLSTGRAIDTRADLSGEWREYTAEIDTTTTGPVRCELYMHNVGQAVQIDAASFV